MTTNDQKKAQRLFLLYQRSKKAETRNTLFLLMKDDILKWMITIYKSYGYLHWDANELLSKSWDCFEYCLKRYKNSGISIVSHFYNYSRFFMMISYYRKKPDDRVEKVDFYSMQNVLTLDDSSTTLLGLSDIINFKNFLNDTYKIIFDEVLEELTSDIEKKQNNRRLETGMGDNRYWEARKTMKIFITYLSGYHSKMPKG